MFRDIVFPEGNEEEFIGIGKRLGYSSIVFAYEGRTLPKEFTTTAIKVKTGMLVSVRDAKKARGGADLALIKGIENSREAIEQARPDILFGLEEVQKRDFIHSRNSGLNQVLCRLAAKNNVGIGFSFSSILESKGMIRAQIMGRMSQNIRLCRKYKAKMVIGSFAGTPYEMRSPHDLAALFCSIGMNPGEAKGALKQ